MSLRIQSIIVKNFKNYSDQHHLNFGEENFICFFGRNGSGKSCIVDAIAFCFGASPAHLRVKKLSDLINDKVRDVDPTASSSVAICFDIKGTDGEVETRWIKRKVGGNSSNSKYFMRENANVKWTPCTATTIRDFLLKHGLDMQLYERFIIRQANTVHLAQMSPLELLDFFERIIGNREILDEIAQCKKECTESNEGFQLLIQQKSDLELRLSDYEPLIARFASYVEKHRCHAISKKRWITKMTKAKNILLKLRTSNLLALEQQIASKCSDIASVEEILRAYDIEYREVDNKIAHLSAQQRQQKKVKKEILQVNVHLEEQHQSLEKEKKLVKKKAQRVENEVSQADKVLTEQDELLRESSDKMGSATVKLEFIKSKQADSADFSYEKERYQKAIQEKIQVQGQYKRLVQLQDDLKKEIKTKMNLVHNGQIQIDKTKSKLLTLRNNIVNGERESDTLREAISKIESGLVVLERKEVHLAQELSRLKDQESSKKSTSKQAMEISRLKKSTKIFGFLFELAIVDSPYFTALNAVLNGVLRHVVVQNRDIAVRVSEEFSRKSLGKVTCAITNEFEFQKVPTEVCPCHRQGSEDYIPLCTVFKCMDESAFRPLFHKYCQSWIVCKDADSAVTFMNTQKRQGNTKQHKKCVTLNGDLFFHDGVIQATQSCKFDPKRSNKYVIAPREFLKDIHKTSENSSASEIVELNSTMNTVLQEKTEKLEEFTNLTNRLRKLESNVMTNTRKSKDVDNLLLDLENKLQSDRKLEIIAKAKLEAFSQEELANAEAKLTSIMAECDKMKCKLSDFSRRQEEKNELETEIQELKRERDAMTQKKRELLALVEVKIYEKQRLTTCLQDLCLQIEELNVTLKKKSKELATIKADLQDLKEQLEHHLENKLRVEIDSRKQQEKREDIEKEVNLLKNQISFERREVDKLLSKSIDYMEEHNSEEDEESDLLDDDHTVEMISDVWQDLQDQEKQLNDDEILLLEIKESIPKDELQKATKMQDELQILENDIKQMTRSLGEISLRQCVLLDMRFSRLFSALESLNLSLSCIYRSINEEGECYFYFSKEKSTLFDEGVIFKCKPDENHWQNFVGLSGGQQVICALSLTLAIQASFPCPIYMFDEIDASLDTVNVAKLGDLLKKLINKNQCQQFIVSHRPEMWERFKLLVGVYESSRSAQLIPCRFES